MQVAKSLYILIYHSQLLTFVHKYIGTVKRFSSTLTLTIGRYGWIEKSHSWLLYDALGEVHVRMVMLGSMVIFFLTLNKAQGFYIWVCVAGQKENWLCETEAENNM